VVDLEHTSRYCFGVVSLQRRDTGLEAHLLCELAIVEQSSNGAGESEGVATWNEQAVAPSSIIEGTPPTWVATPGVRPTCLGQSVGAVVDV